MTLSTREIQVLRIFFKETKGATEKPDITSFLWQHKMPITDKMHNLVTLFYYKFCTKPNVKEIPRTKAIVQFFNNL